MPTVLLRQSVWPILHAQLTTLFRIKWSRCESLERCSNPTRSYRGVTSRNTKRCEVLKNSGRQITALQNSGNQGISLNGINHLLYFFFENVINFPNKICMLFSRIRCTYRRSHEDGGLPLCLPGRRRTRGSFSAVSPGSRGCRRRRTRAGSRAPAPGS